MVGRRGWWLGVLVAISLGCSSAVTVIAGGGEGGGQAEAAGEAAPVVVPPPLPLDACEPGAAPVTVGTFASPAGLALDDDTLFVSDQGGLYDCDGAIYAVSLRGGEPTVLVDGLCAPNRLVHADGSLYWLRHSGYVAPNGYVERLDLATGDVEEMAGWLISPDALAVDERFLFVGADVSVGLQSRGRVVRIDRQTREMQELATSAGRPADIAVDDTYVYWSSSVGFLNGQENHDGEVLRVPKASGTPEVLAAGLAWPSGLARVGTQLVLAHSHDGLVVTLGADGGEATDLAAGLSYPQDVAVAGGMVLFSTWGDTAGALHEARLDGGASAAEVAAGIGRADQIAMGATCVYWTEQYVDDDFQGVVRRVAWPTR